MIKIYTDASKNYEVVSTLVVCIEDSSSISDSELVKSHYIKTYIICDSITPFSKYYILHRFSQNLNNIVNIRNVSYNFNRLKQMYTNKIKVTLIKN